MWFGIGTTGEAAASRPLCVLVHYLVCLNVAALIAVQGAYMLLLGGRAAISPAWGVASGCAVFVHVAFGFLYAWLDGDPIAFGGSGEVGWGGDGSDGGSDGGGDGGGGGD